MFIVALMTHVESGRSSISEENIALQLCSACQVPVLFRIAKTTAGPLLGKPSCVGIILLGNGGKEYRPAHILGNFLVTWWHHENFSFGSDLVHNSKAQRYNNRTNI